MSWLRAGALAALVVLLCGLLTVTAGAYEGSSLYDNVAPESQLQNSQMVDKLPLNRYGLDYHVTAGVESTDVGIMKVPHGLDLTDFPALAAHAFAAWMWEGIRFMLSIAITVFTFAFSLDLINGSNGALAPIARATQDLYKDLGPWLPIGIICVGAWAMVRILRRRYASTWGQLGLSLLYVMLAMWIVTQPMTTIGGVSRWSNELSNAILAEMDGRASSNMRDAKTTAADRLFRDLIYEPWVAMNFGGLEHCVNAKNEPVKPRSRDCVTRINHERKYAARWLAAGEGNGKARSLWYKAIHDGKVPDRGAIDAAGLPPNAFDGVHLSEADKAAVDAQQAPAVGERLVTVTGVGFASAGAAVLLGSLSFGMILMQVFSLLLFYGSPFVLLFAMFPGPGHALFEAWLSKLAYSLTRKILYALVLSSLLTITHAVRTATVDLGWGASYGLVGAFFILVVVFRHEIYDYIERSLPGGQHAGGHGSGLAQRADGTYYTVKMATPVAQATSAVALVPIKGAKLATRGGARVLGLAAHGANEVAWDSAGKKLAKTQRDSGSLFTQALSQLEGEHAGATKRLRREESRRAQLRALQSRARITDQPTDPNAPKPLTETERQQ